MDLYCCQYLSTSNCVRVSSIIFYWFKVRFNPLVNLLYVGFFHFSRMLLKNTTKYVMLETIRKRKRNVAAVILLCIAYWPLQVLYTGKKANVFRSIPFPLLRFKLLPHLVILFSSWTFYLWWVTLKMWSRRWESGLLTDHFIALEHKKFPDLQIVFSSRTLTGKLCGNIQSGC